MADKVVLGIDPGVANTGWAVVEKREDKYVLVDFGVVETKKGEKVGRRLFKIKSRLVEVVEKYGVEAVAYEMIYFAKNVRSAIGVAMTVGVIELLIEENDKVGFGYTPLQIKMALTGAGRGDKDQVEKMVGVFLERSEEIKPSHAADAAAVALTFIFDQENLRKVE